MPPAPMRAMGVTFSARPMISSISPSRPKKILGGGGGDSPSTLDRNVRTWSHDIRHCQPGLSLDNRHCLFGDGWSTGATYSLIFTANILRTFQHVLVDVGNHGVSTQGQLGLGGSD